LIGNAAPARSGAHGGEQLFGNPQVYRFLLGPVFELERRKIFRADISGQVLIQKIFGFLTGFEDGQSLAHIAEYDLLICWARLG